MIRNCRFNRPELRGAVCLSGFVVAINVILNLYQLQTLLSKIAPGTIIDVDFDKW